MSSLFLCIKSLVRQQCNYLGVWNGIERELVEKKVPFSVAS